MNHVTQESIASASGCADPSRIGTLLDPETVAEVD